MVRKLIGAWLGAAVIAVSVVGCAQTDPGITTAVKAKLAADDTVKAYRIDVDTSDRVVTLTGNVDSTSAKGRAVELARATDGVRDVVDRLTVAPGATPTTGVDDAAQAKAGDVARDASAAASDAQKKAGNALDRAGEATADAAVTAAVKTKLLADTEIAGLNIDVDTTKNVVTLTGTVKTAAEKQKALRLARGTEGVKTVVDKLTVGK